MSGFVWDPAWRDERLGAACTDVRAGIVGAAREVLAETRSTRDFARRGYASALLGALGAAGNLAALWLRDSPRDPDALLFAARVRAALAANALRQSPYGSKGFVDEAMAAIRAAAAAWPDDPTPWVILLGLAKYHRAETADEPSSTELAGLPGPWALVEGHIWPRDPHNREAGRHLLEYFSPRYCGSNTDMARVAGHLAQRSPENCPLRLLPLAARIEAEPDPEAEAAERAARFNRAEQIKALIITVSAEMDAIRAGTWVGEKGRPPPDPVDLRARIEKLRRVAAHEEAELASDSRCISNVMSEDLSDLYASWFLTHEELDPRGPAGYVPLADVSLLAHGLHLAGHDGYAAVVFRRLYPYASRYPWSLYGDPSQVLEKTLRELRASGARLG